MPWVPYAAGSSPASVTHSSTSRLYCRVVTDFRGPESIKQSVTRIDDYRDTAGKSRAGTQAGHRKQQGDPVRGARAIIRAVEAENSPIHMLIGGDALDQLRTKLDDMRRETDAWEDVIRGTDSRATRRSEPRTATARGKVRSAFRVKHQRRNALG